MRARAATFQSEGDTENRRRAEKSEATAVEIIEKIGEMIFLESASRPSALLLSLENSSETSLGENCESTASSGIWEASVPLLRFVSIQRSASNKLSKQKSGSSGGVPTSQKCLEISSGAHSHSLPDLPMS